jgi:predicted helicase
MPIDHRSVLANIRRFDQLIKYLRDEMGWPISQDSFDDDDDLFYDFTTEELGIDMKNAAKIQRIQRLRPLSTHQPWGIFFVKFEPKQLPVVALRRILGQVAVKKRASANNPEQAAWSADDLLFVSNYGEGESRQISFAHFAQSKSKKDLPTLKVLDWNNLDTKLHLNHVADLLTEKLSWPEDEENQIEWRKNWSSAFTLTHKEVIITSKKLSKELAALARNIRDLIKKILAIETENGAITRLMESFKKSLIHDLDEAGFADMYAQTIAYGLLSARITNPSGDSADDIIEAMPITNPFLKELMETFLDVGGRKKRGSKLIGIDFDELGISEIVELLDASNMEAVVRDFGDQNPQEDPVIHFFEGFLEEYDKKIRKDRGVFYTPRSVVSFIVRSVDELLRTEFNLEDGLADVTTWREMTGRIDNLKIPEGVSPEQAFVQILDPATGTGTFLVEVIDIINKTMTEKWQSMSHDKKKINELWNNYVSEHLLPRLYGYELMMAPYAIAHMKIGLKLYETGYHFESDQRARIYLTNALEPAQDFSGTLAFAIPALAHETEAVNAIKRDLRVTVVIGNPPYSGISSNMAPWIDGLLKGKLPNGSTTNSYYHVDRQSLDEKKIWLQDDYVKFTRWSQHSLQCTGVGIHGFITNHGYLDNPTFRGMRWSLMETFNKIRILDLHGNSKKKEVPPEGGRDANVFDIQQGVGIGLFVRQGMPRSGIEDAFVHHAELWGEREQKYRWLTKRSVGEVDWKTVDTRKPFYLFVPFDQGEVGDYTDWPAINVVIPINVSGVVTARDGFVMDFDRPTLHHRIADLRDTVLSDDAIREEYFRGKGSSKYPAGDSRGWKLPVARQKIREDEQWEKRYTSILYRPFDVREIYYVPWMVDWPRMEVMPHMLAGENLAIITARSNKFPDPNHFFSSRMVVETKCGEASTQSATFPLYIYPGVYAADDSMFHNWPMGKGGRRPNLDLSFVQTIEQVTCLDFESDGRSGLSEAFGPEDVLAYVYAIFHSPEYRRRFKQMLKLDFPRVPHPGTCGVFIDLVRLGKEVLDMHLMESPRLNVRLTTVTGSGDLQIEKVSYSDETVWIDKAKTRGFKCVPEEVWNFYIGGYQVCQKWLKDRGPKKNNPGRVLTNDDIDHYQKIVVALSETIRIMTEIDEVIENHGGWPGAFQDS